VPGYDDCLNGAAQAGFGQASAKQPAAGALPSGIRHDHEVIDLTGRAAGVVDRRRAGQGGDEESGQLAGLFAYQGDDLVVADQPGQVGAVLVQRAGGRPPEQRLVAGVLLAPDSCQGGRIDNQSGAGLGLSIVASVARTHGGRAKAHARPAGGLDVQIKLQATPPQHTYSPVPARPQANALPR
jgi:hypothetical protein